MARDSFREWLRGLIYQVTIGFDLGRNITSVATPQDDPQVTPQVEQLVQVLVGNMSRSDLQAALGLRDRKSFHERYLAPALAEGFIEMTLPAKPNSRLQKYRLTNKGQNWLRGRNGE